MPKTETGTEDTANRPADA